MKTAYINEPGIRPWELTRPTTDVEFTTTTLINRDFKSVWESWCEAMGQLSTAWPFKREWSSVTGADFNSKTEEYLFNKDIATKIKCGEFFKKNEKSNIYSTIKNRPNDPRQIEHLALQGSHDVILAIQKNEIDMEELWKKMTIFEFNITPEKIRKFLKSQVGTFICRFYDTETHAAAQFIYQSCRANDVILEEVKNRFYAITIEDVHIYINCPQEKYNLDTTKPPA